MILLDTDVLIDVALDRRPHSAPAAELLDRIEHGAETAFIAWHSVSNLYYLVTPALGGVSARDFIVELIRFVAVAATGADAIRYAAGLPMEDFEDAMQVAAARACGAPAHSHQEHPRLPTLSHPRGPPPGRAQRTFLTPVGALRHVR